LTEDESPIHQRKTGFLCKCVKDDLALELLGFDLDDFVCDILAVGRGANDIHSRRIETHHPEKFRDGDGRKGGG
jgi:hypothetical protein